MQTKSKIKFVTMLFLLFVCAKATGQASNPFVISIDTLKLDSLRQTDTLDINLFSKGQPVGGLVLKFGHDSPLFKIETIITGEIPDSCNWKIFNSREAAEAGTEGRPQAMWQILTMAEFGPDSTRSTCNTFEHAASVARLVISIDTIQIKELTADTLLPIYFYWEDCSDNTIANARGDSLFISEEVDGKHWTHPDVVTEPFPTRLGASSKCINSRALNPPKRNIHLHNGGVLVRIHSD